MAKKKKASKQRQKRKQKKQQRRKARVHNQSSGGGSSRRGGGGSQMATMTGSPLLEDALPLFPLVDDVSALPPEAAYEGFLLAALDTADLVDEPEFAEIVPDPMVALTSFIDSAEQVGDDADEFFALEAEEREEVFLQALEQMVEEMLTDEMRAEILDAVNALRLRLKRDRKRKDDVPRVAALQLMLEGNETEEFWYGAGLVQAIYQRSVRIGFELSSTMVELSGEGKKLDIRSFLEGAASAEKIDELTERLEQIPGFDKYLDDQIDTMWEEGLHASFMGELDLEIFSDEEIEDGAKIWANATQQAADDLNIEDDDEVDTATLLPQIAKRAVPPLGDYVHELFSTPKRRAQLADHLTHAQEQYLQTDSKWAPFVMMVQRHASEDPEYLLESGYLTRAFLGELRNRGLEFANGAEAGDNPT